MEKKNFARYMDAWFDAVKVRDSYKKNNPNKKYEVMVRHSEKTVQVCEEVQTSGKLITVYECTFGNVE
jgi:hypothetical protein